MEFKDAIISHAAVSTMAAMIERTLTHEQKGGGRAVIRQDEILSFSDPVIILGDPGLGKTVLTQWLGDQPGMKFVRADTFVRTARPTHLHAGIERIVVDGLDEVPSAAPGGAVDAVLKQLSAIDYPPFVLSCRAADWLGATDRVKIEDDYGKAPVLLHLRPFSEDDAHAFLSKEFSMVDSAEVLAHLTRCGIDSLYENPLTLGMLGKVAQANDPLPQTRAQLFDRACRVMLREINPHHRQDSHARRSEEDLLLAAGAICASELLCGRIGIYDGPPAETPDGYLNMVDVDDLPFAQTVTDVLRVRLFQSDGENRFTHVHRVIAEYLGAKWLARSFEDGASEKRIFALFGEGNGVPTSLRGLHAWMAHFNETLAYRCIEADPYAVLRYGDAETLNIDQARALLAALKKLSGDDPYFRSEDWGRHPLSGLLRTELRNDVRAIIDPPHSHIQLTTLLLEAMAGTKLAETLDETLDSIVFDGRRHVRERSAAAKALYVVDACNASETVINRLLDMNDPDSARLAFETLERLGVFGVPDNTAVDTILAYVGLPSNFKTNEYRRLPDEFFSGLDAGRLASWLDRLVGTARPLMEQAEFGAKWCVTRLVRDLVATVLEADATVPPGRIWNWIEWLDRRRAHGGKSNKRLVALFRENGDLRAGFLEHVLLTPCAKTTLLAGCRLGDMGLDLYPTPEDVARVLRVLRARSGDNGIDVDTWRGLLRLGDGNADGLPAAVRTAAVDVADGDRELLSILDKFSTTAAEGEGKQADWEAKRKARREAACHAHRLRLAERAADVAAGDVRLLQLPARVYLGRSVELDADLHFDAEAAPEERLRALLGDELADRVMSGFVAVLARDDLPNASRIADMQREGTCTKAESPMICGVMEMFRRGIDLGELERDKLAAAYMAWQSGPDCDSSEPNPIASAMEAVLFRRMSDLEDFFRASIEPYLDRNWSYSKDLTRLVCDTELSELAGCLSTEWLRRYPALNTDVQTQLIDCALGKASREEVRKLVADRRKRAHPDLATRLLWLSANYVVDFEGCRPALDAVTTSHPEFIWTLRDRIGSDSGQRVDRLSIDHLKFIVESFGGYWENVPRATGVTVGDRNPADASEFIQDAIYAIAGRPDSNATIALQYLISSHAPTYTETMRHALARQLKFRRDAQYSALTVSELRSAVTDSLPESIDQMRAYFADRIDELQKRIRGSNTDMWEVYWDGDQPRDEIFCRNRMIEHILGQLDPSIRFEPERQMPGKKRVDIAAVRNAVGLPVEIKGQWHREVWNAACDQLDANYARDWQAQGRGAYVVLWFGDVARKRLWGHPDGLERPGTPEALRRMLVERLPEERRSRIDVFVLDVTRPA